MIPTLTEVEKIAIVEFIKTHKHLPIKKQLATHIKSIEKKLQKEIEG